MSDGCRWISLVGLKETYRALKIHDKPLSFQYVDVTSRPVSWLAPSAGNTFMAYKLLDKTPASAVILPYVGAFALLILSQGFSQSFTASLQQCRARTVHILQTKMMYEVSHREIKYDGWSARYSYKRDLLSILLGFKVSPRAVVQGEFQYIKY